FQSRSQQLGPSPFYWSLQSSFSSLGRGDKFGNNDLPLNFLRYDVFPTTSYPINYLSWITFTPTFGYRITHYGKQQTGQTQLDVPIVRNEPVPRNYKDSTMVF